MENNNNKQKEKKVMFDKDTIYSKVRTKWYDAVANHQKLDDAEWDREKNECYIYEAFGDRGVFARMQRKANNKGWVVFFHLCMTTEKKPKPFVRNINITLTINETANGVKFLWFINNKPLWGREASFFVNHYLFFYTGYIVRDVMEQVETVYTPEDFIPILKYMPLPYAKDPVWTKYKMERTCTPYGLNEKHINRLSKGTNPKEILNNIYGKSGQYGLTKNAFGGVNRITNYNKFVVASEIVRYLKPFPLSFFEKIVLPEFSSPEINTYGIAFAGSEVSDIQYFAKYFKGSKVQNDFIEDINNYIGDIDGYEGSNGSEDSAYRILRGDVWIAAIDAGRMFKGIKNRTIRKNIIATNGTVQEIHDLITIEEAKLTKEDKKIQYKKAHLELDGKRVTDKIVSVLPQTTLDLVLWGSQQHNCIGSYADRVSDSSHTIIVGFKDESTGQWIGHAELIRGTDLHSNRRPWTIRQIAAKYNKNLDGLDEVAVRKFLKTTTNLWGSNYIDQMK